ncbi:MAG: hypothetical protein JWP40_3728 [Blastococcus sp.]|nr:hypothetical protein [Blastococcus sp.]
MVVSPRGRADTSKTHSWSLNAGQGIVLRGQAAGSRFLASMHYRSIPTDPEKYDIQQGRWRVTTLAYLYEFRTPDNAKLWAMHCIRPARATPPSRTSTCTPSSPTVTSPRRDRRSSQRCSGAVVAELQNTQWRTVLAESEGVHQLYRSWSDDAPPSTTGG